MRGISKKPRCKYLLTVKTITCNSVIILTNQGELYIGQRLEKLKLLDSRQLKYARSLSKL